MLQVRGDGVVSGLQQAVDGRIQGLGGVGREDHVVRAGAAEEGRQLPAGVVDHPGGVQGGAVSAPGGIPQTLDGRDHRPGHLRRLVQAGGGAVEIDHGPSPQSSSGAAVVSVGWGGMAAITLSRLL